MACASLVPRDTQDANWLLADVHLPLPAVKWLLPGVAHFEVARCLDQCTSTS